jgi:hypothetical protein
MLWAVIVITGYGVKKPNYSTVYTGAIHLYFHLHTRCLSRKVVTGVKF